MTKAPDQGKASRLAKRRRTGVCIDCGGVTRYVGAKGRPIALRCSMCSSIHNGRGNRKHTRESIVERIQEWVELYGSPPTVLDWNPSAARSRGHEEQAKRFESGNWPWFSAVYRRFGSWAKAVEAAGFRPRSRGHQGDA